MDKKSWLDKLHYDFDKQRGNLELAYLQPEGPNSKWIKHIDAQADEKFLEIANNRTILPNEIVIDIEEPEQFQGTLEQIKRDFEFYSAYSTGSRGYHIHIFFEEPVDKENKKEVIEIYNGDKQKATERTMIALENCPHWKTGKNKTLIEEVIGFNSINAISKAISKNTIRLTQHSFLRIKKILRKYIDTSEENYSLISLWIIGTYTHSVFSSYPYLFFNAMKGSGKSRTIKLIICLSYNGRLVMDLTDAVLFRTAKGSTLGIDEFENVVAKEKTTLRTLLNSAYKKGVKVARMKKVKAKGQESMEVEEFEVYAPIVMANINGMDNVLSDRCITIIQERTTDDRINRLIEDFDKDKEIQAIKEQLSVNLVKLMQLVSSKNIISEWNDYVGFMCSPETTQTTLPTQITPDKLKIFEKIYGSDIKARHLELFFPLFVIASLMGEEFLDKIIETAKSIVSVKKSEDLVESRDVALIEFISNMQQTLDFTSITELTRQFKDYMQEEDEQYHTITAKWFGRALKRLNLIIEKRRLGRGVEVIVNVVKAKEKIRLFKSNKPDEISNNSSNNTK
jgi:hypothetical protein